MSDHITHECLSAYMDDACTALEKEHIQSHLQTCSPCQETLDHLRSAQSWIMASTRHAMPNDLMTSLRRRTSTSPFWKNLWTVFHGPRVWIPAGVAVLCLGTWAGFQSMQKEETLPLEPLLAAHARYDAEGLARHTDLAAATFTNQLASYENPVE